MDKSILDPMWLQLNTLDRHELLKVLVEVKKGNLSARMPIDKEGLPGKICDTLNDIIALNANMISEFKGDLTAQVRNIAKVISFTMAI